jgi:hypothetical protein
MVRLHLYGTFIFCTCNVAIERKQLTQISLHCCAPPYLAGTVDCEYPRWVEFLCHDISVHVPHHVSSKIPWYNLRKANDSLKQNWGQYMTSCTFNWRMMKTIFTGEGGSGARVQARDNRTGAGECLWISSWRSACGSTQLARMYWRRVSCTVPARQE